MQVFHNTPSLGYIAWEDVHIQYKGTTYNIPNGNTDKRFVIWRYADPDCFYGSDEFPTLGPEDLLVFLNKNGTYAIVPKTQIVDGSLIVSDSIMTDAIAANAVTTAKIAAGAITADLIAANAIGAGAIAAGAVTADKIAAGEIATTHLAALAVTADKLAAGAVTAEKIAAGAISTDKLSIGLADTIEATPRTIAPDTETYFPFDGGLASTRGIQPTFTRGSVATNPDTGAIVAANEPRFVQGKFGQAVLVEEETTNILNYESSFSKWSSDGSNMASLTTRTGKHSFTVKGTSTVPGAYSYVYPYFATSNTQHSLSCQVRNNNNKTLIARAIIRDGSNGIELSDNVEVQIPAGQTRKLTVSTSTAVSSSQVTPAVSIFSDAGDGSVDAEVFMAQCEAKPYATSFIDGTRSLETLTVPISEVLDPSAGTIEGWVMINDKIANGLGWSAFFTHANPTWPTNALYMARCNTPDQKIHFRFNTLAWTSPSPIPLVVGERLHWVYRWDSEKITAYLNGQLLTERVNTAPNIQFADSLRVGSFYSGGEVPCAPMSGLRLHRRALSDEEIAAHAQAAAAPYDPRSLVGAIDADVRTVTALDNQITMDSTGLKMRRAGETIDRMHLDARRLGFRDPSTGTPTAGIGYVRDLAQELDPEADPETLIGHGLFIAQGEIRATQAVLSDSLTEGGTGMTKLADGSVALPKLADTLSVTLPNRFVLHVGQTIDDLNVLVNPDFESGNLQGWTGTGTIYSGDAHTGTYSVYDCNIYQDVAASAGQAWTGQAWLRDTYRRSYVTLQFLNASKTVLSTHDSPVCGGGGWHCLYVTAVAPANTAYARLVIKTQNNHYNVRFDDCALACTGIATSYTTFLDTTLPAADACEQLKINTSIDNPDGVTVYTRVLVNGTVVLGTTGVTQLVTASVTLDTRGIDGDIRVQVQAKTNSGVATWNQAEVHHNQRLPLRGAPPRYTIVEEAESSCGAPCEASCQTQCQKACEAACQAECQDACQHACESTCEKTSQGGGCWVTGTPVTVIDGDRIYDVPVEELKPGMMMPWYDPVTDTLQESECLSNQRTYTHTIYVAEVEGGYTLEMTGEQPMDVLRPHYATGEIVWHKIPARYIRPGDKLVRPFDGTLHEVLSLEQTQRAKTWVYNPRTASGRYIVHGFADSEKLLT